jgi:hypothetical protein
MYSKFLLVLGAAFILFIISQFVGYLFRSGFSEIFKILLIRLVIIISAVTVGFFMGVFGYSLITGSAAQDNFQNLSVFLQRELSSVW